MILIKDSEFIRGKCPMTKEEIRALSIWKMNLKENSIVLDVGAGTGSITVQASKLVEKGQVYSVEKEEEAFNTSRSNIKKFNCTNVRLIKDEGTNTLNDFIQDDLKFNSIFIGGSGGKLEEIISLSNKLLAIDGTIVMNFITLENLYKGTEELKRLGYKIDISLVNISKNRNDGYMMMAQNPIYILQGIREEK